MKIQYVQNYRFFVDFLNSQKRFGREFRKTHANFERELNLESNGNIFIRIGWL